MIDPSIFQEKKNMPLISSIEFHHFRKNRVFSFTFNQGHDRSIHFSRKEKHLDSFWVQKDLEMTNMKGEDEK